MGCLHWESSWRCPSPSTPIWGMTLPVCFFQPARLQQFHNTEKFQMDGTGVWKCDCCRELHPMALHVHCLIFKIPPSALYWKPRNRRLAYSFEGTNFPKNEKRGGRMSTAVFLPGLAQHVLEDQTVSKVPCPQYFLLIKSVEWLQGGGGCAIPSPCSAGFFCASVIGGDGSWWVLGVSVDNSPLLSSSRKPHNWLP